MVILGMKLYSVDPGSENGHLLLFDILEVTLDQYLQINVKPNPIMFFLSVVTLLNPSGKEPGRKAVHNPFPAEWNDSHFC